MLRMGRRIECPRYVLRAPRTLAARRHLACLMMGEDAGRTGIDGCNERNGKPFASRWVKVNQA